MSVPKYYGYNFDSGEQIEYFKPMLTDKTLTMCQDVTPNTSEGKEMMYAITWNEAGIASTFNFQNTIIAMLIVDVYLSLATACRHAYEEDIVQLRMDEAFFTYFTRFSA